MNRLAARCPGCQSVFFVSAAHGKVANNLVRCGRCGHLFSLAEHLTDTLPIDEPESPEVFETNPQTQTPESAAAETISTFEEQIGSNDEHIPQQEPVIPNNSPTENDLKSTVSVIGTTDLDENPFFDPPKIEASLSEDFQIGTPSKRKPSLWRHLGLVALILTIGVAGLSGQYIFFYAPELSQQTQYRPWLQHFCNVLPCQVTAFSEPKLVRIEQITVRAHPDLAGSLIVKLILTNTAEAEQAYPALELRFDDLYGRQVATRRFTPKEYLPRILKPILLMPTDKSVSIKLAIVDPGETAVSYSVLIKEPLNKSGRSR